MMSFIKINHSVNSNKHSLLLKENIYSLMISEQSDGYIEKLIYSVVGQFDVVVFH